MMGSGHGGNCCFGSQSAFSQWKWPLATAVTAEYDKAIYCHKILSFHRCARPPHPYAGCWRILTLRETAASTLYNDAVCFC